MNKEEIIRDLYLEYKDKIYGYIYNHTRHKETAEDLMASVFAKIVEAFESYDSSRASYSTWIYTITRNTLISYYRKNKHEQLDIEDMTLESDQKSPEELAVSTEEQQELADCLKQLSERERDIIIARHYYNYSFKKIGDMMNTTEGNCRIINMRALEKLKKLLGNYN